MKKFKNMISAFYLILMLVIIFCVPISAIMIICKLCQVTSLSWINCCTPIIITIALAPFVILSKILIDNKEG